uniref:Uncharacterized protein n=1 Tax=Oryza glumipatula TaxID=40148 RepID=A0A0E0A4A8_9ORYZ
MQNQQQQQQQEEEESWGNQYTNFKWYDVVLSVVAALVAVLAMAVLVEAALVMRFNQYDLELKVRHGVVKVKLLQPPPWMRMNFTLATTNPITNTAATDVNISLSVTDITVTSGNKSLTEFHVDGGHNVSVGPGHTEYVIWLQNANDSSFFDQLEHNGKVTIELRVRGDIDTRITPLNKDVFNPPSRHVVFDCAGVSLTVVDDLSMIDHGGNKDDDVSCSYV